MSKNQKILIAAAGSASLLALGGLVYYFKGVKDEAGKAELNKLGRDDVIKILKALNKEFFHVFTNFSMVSSQIKQQSMGRASPQEIRMILLEQPMFRDEIENLENKVYERFGVTKEEFQSLLESKYKEDPEIGLLQKNMKDSFDKSFQGVPPEIKTDIPDFLTPSKVIEILKKVMISSITKLNDKLLELLEAGEQLDYNNPKLMQIMQELRMDSAKDDILKEYKLDQYEENANKILQYATQVYSLSNKDGFGDSMKSLETNYQQLMQQILTKGPMMPNQIQSIMNRENKPAMNPVFAGMTGAQKPPQKIVVEQPKPDPQAQFVTEPLKPTQDAEQLLQPQHQPIPQENVPEVQASQGIEKVEQHQPVENIEKLPEQVEKQVQQEEKIKKSPEQVEKIESSPVHVEKPSEIVEQQHEKQEQPELIESHEAKHEEINAGDHDEQNKEEHH